jgi:DNA transposition AAA+ family ATPase
MYSAISPEASLSAADSMGRHMESESRLAIKAAIAAHGKALDEHIARMEAAKTHEEMLAVLDKAPSLPPDLIAMIEEAQRLTA